MLENITTIEDLAALIQRTMASKEDIGQLRSQVKEDIAELRTEMKDGFLNINTRLDYIREEVEGLPAMRQELQELRERVKRLEQRAGLTI